MKPTKGTGSLYKQKGSRYWWIRYYANGKPYRESTKTENLDEAQRILADRVADITKGTFVPNAKLRYPDLAAALLNDYIANRRKSLVRKKDGEAYVPGEPELRNFFGEGCLATAITTARVRGFRAKQIESGFSNATINRSLSALKRMFSLVREQIRYAPAIEELQEDNARKGFLEHDQYLKLRQELPAHVRPVFVMGYYTGMRLGEIRCLRWEQVNFFDREVRLNPGETKNNKGRTVPIQRELLETLKGLKVEQDAKHPNCEWVFIRNGNRIGSFRKVWASACKRAGLEELLFHDLRRTAVRNLVRAGVSEKVAMTISGHRSRAIFDRYDIVDSKDIQDAGKKLEAFLNEREKAIRENEHKIEHSQPAGAATFAN